MDVFHKLLQFIDYNRWAVIGVVVGLILTIGLVGCQPETKSLLDPQMKVSAIELQREIITLERMFSEKEQTIDLQIANMNATIEEYNDLIEIAELDLERQVELRNKIVEAAAGLANLAVAGTLTPTAAVGTLITLMTTGAAAGFGLDNIRKGRKIKTQKQELASNGS